MTRRVRKVGSNGDCGDLIDTRFVKFLTSFSPPQRCPQPDAWTDLQTTGADGVSFSWFGRSLSFRPMLSCAATTKGGVFARRGAPISNPANPCNHPVESYAAPHTGSFDLQESPITLHSTSAVPSIRLLAHPARRMRFSSPFLSFDPVISVSHDSSFSPLPFLPCVRGLHLPLHAVAPVRGARCQRSPIRPPLPPRQRHASPACTPLKGVVLGVQPVPFPSRGRFSRHLVDAPEREPGWLCTLATPFGHRLGPPTAANHRRPRSYSPFSDVFCHPHLRPPPSGFRRHVPPVG